MPLARAPASRLGGLFFKRTQTWNEAVPIRNAVEGRSEQLVAPEDANQWQQYWGESYGPELKQWMLAPVFDRLEAEGKIGDLIIDVGSGALPVTGILKPTPARKRICVDIASDNVASGDTLGVRLDAEKAGQLEDLSFRKVLLRACAFLEINPRTEIQTELADTMVFSEVLNYVDFRKVLQGFSNFLKPGGRMIVINLPFRGNRSLFSERGLKDNRQLYAFLEELDFETEFKAFPKKPPQEADESEEFIVLVAKKNSRTSISARPGIGPASTPP
jgi:SAM-dependent methyltransferase